MTGPSRPPQGPPPPTGWSSPSIPGGQPCAACGLLNDPGARVCRNCGMPIGTLTDPLRGVSTRPMDLPAQRSAGLGAVIGLLAVVGVLVVAGFLVLGGEGLLSGGGKLIVAQATATPASSGGVAGSLAPGTSPGPGTSGAPPVDPGSVLTRTTFSCESGRITDITKGSWRLTGIESSARSEWDEVTFALERAGEADATTNVSFEWMKPIEAAQTFGIDKPVGARALVATFDGPVAMATANDVTGDLKAVRTVDVRAGDDGKLRAVVGVRGQGCARLMAPAWTKPGPDETAKILLDIRRE